VSVCSDEGFLGEIFGPTAVADQGAGDCNHPRIFLSVKGVERRRICWFRCGDSRSPLVFN
jgi:hypothetical protein